MTGYTRDDLAAAPRWHVGPAGEAFIAKGSYIVLVLQEAEDSESVYVYRQGELIAIRGSKESAVSLAEDLVARWFPEDPKVASPADTPAVGTKTADGKKVVSSNPYAAPI